MPPAATLDDVARARVLSVRDYTTGVAQPAADSALETLVVDIVGRRAALNRDAARHGRRMADHGHELISGRQPAVAEFPPHVDAWSVAGAGST